MPFPSAVDLSSALANGEIEAHFQPQIDLTSDVIVGVEVLARWRHEGYGMIAPDVFIPLAEQSGLIHDLGHLMVLEGCRRAADWSAAGRSMEVAVNVSATQLAEPDYAAKLVAIVEQLALPPQTLTLEITETLPILDVPRVVARLDVMRSYGIGVSVDDFGVGHSSLAQVDTLPVTELKIDLSIVQDESPGAHELLVEIVTLSRARGLRIVAEGVETRAQLERVRSIGCDRAQGFLVGRPMPYAELAALL